MKIISWNVNGIRAAYRHGFPEWLAKADPDIVCLQEIKAKEEELSGLFAGGLFGSGNYHIFSNPAEKSGYSGVAVFTKIKPSAVRRELGMERFDREGRLLVLTYPDFILMNVYIPHGGREKENLDYKLAVYETLFTYLKAFKDKPVILAGDFNVAHEELDLARPQDNQHNTMFTPEERRKLDAMSELGFTDSFRQFHEDGGHYTWWPYAALARERNLGWRIDYIFASRTLAPKLKDAFILSDVTGSDHCPIGIEV